MWEIDLEQRDGEQVVRLSGEFDLATRTPLEDVLERCTGPLVTIDLSGVTFLDAWSALLLLRQRRRLAGSGTRMRTRGAEGPARRVIVLVGGDALLADDTGAAAG